MELILAIVIGTLVAAGIFRLLGGTRLDALVGILLLSQAANLIVFASGGLRHGAAPLLNGSTSLSDDDSALLVHGLYAGDDPAALVRSIQGRYLPVVARLPV